ncbi:MAG: polysaccharide biosynthesis C-terminal domain-containing protein [Firmicutes bacterium]|nr:polysaccharide biosynthesis C-terminal domain-containing protein [Bacillota bacterium]
MSIAVNSLRTYIFRIFTGLSGIIIGILIARLLGPQGKGYYSGVFIFYNIFIQVGGTLGAAIVYQIARQKQDPRVLLMTASLFNLGLGLLTILGFKLFTILVPQFHPGPIWLVVALIPWALILSNITGVFQGLNRIITLNWISIIQGLIQISLLLFGFFLPKFNVDDAIVFWLVSHVLAAIITLWISREFWLPPVKNWFSWPLLGAMLRFSAQISLNNGIGILNAQIDSLLVLFLLHTKNYGLYSVAVNGASVLWYTTGAITIAITAHVGKADREAAGRLTARAVRHTLLINIPLALIMWGAAWLIPLVYGQRFSASMAPFRIMLPGILAYSIAAIFNTYFTNQLGKPRIPLLISFISMMIDLVGSLLLIPRFGMLGGAAANSASYLISISILTGIFCRTAGFSLKDIFAITKDDVADYKLLWDNLMRFLNRKLKRE